MTTLIVLYWLSFGIGLLYVLIAGTLGAFTHGFGGGAHEAGADAGGGLDLHAEAAGDMAGGALESGDLDAGADFDTDSAALDMGGGHAALDMGAGHAALDTGHAAIDHHAEHVDVAHDHAEGAVEYSPYSPLSIMGFFCAFGGTGLIAAAYRAGALTSLSLATAGGVLMAVVLWLVVGKLLFGMQGSSEAHQVDMVGLEAEVLVPVQDDMAGEIAYVLDGVRYTAPARLAHPGTVGRTEKVRIRRISGNLVYVEEKKKLLA